jgi:hypothetical protein
MFKGLHIVILPILLLSFFSAMLVPRGILAHRDIDNLLRSNIELFRVDSKGRTFIKGVETNSEERKAMLDRIRQHRNENKKRQWILL